MINALILVPEITKGMKSIGSKSLLEIKKKLSVLDYQIQSIKNIDKSIKISVCTGFDSERIIDNINDNHSNISYVYNENYKTTNQAYSIKIYLEQNTNCDQLLIVSNGVLFKDKCITKTMLNNECKVFLLNKTRENFNLGCSTQHHFEYLFYDLPELWSECIFLNKEALTVLRNLFTSNYTTQMYLFELINEMINQKIVFKKQYIDKKSIMKICNLKDIAKAKNFI
jgi:hypothetical protein